MRMGRAAMFVSLALSIGVAPLVAHAQQPAGPPPQIQAAQTFLMTWGGEKWDEMKAVTADTVTVKVADKDHAFEWLEKAYQEKTDEMVSLRTRRCYDFLRADPRYKDLERRVGYAWYNERPAKVIEAYPKWKARVRG